MPSLKCAAAWFGAVAAGVTFRDGCAVTGLLRDDDGRVTGVTYKDPDGEVVSDTTRAA